MLLSLECRFIQHSRRLQQLKWCAKLHLAWSAFTAKALSPPPLPLPFPSSTSFEEEPLSTSLAEEGGSFECYGVEAEQKFNTPTQ